MPAPRAASGHKAHISIVISTKLYAKLKNKSYLSCVLLGPTFIIGFQISKLRNRRNFEIQKSVTSIFILNEVAIRRLDTSVSSIKSSNCTFESVTSLTIERVTQAVLSAKLRALLRAVSMAWLQAPELQLCVLKLQRKYYEKPKGRLHRWQHVRTLHRTMAKPSPYAASTHRKQRPTSVDLALSILAVALMTYGGLYATMWHGYSSGSDLYSLNNQVCDRIADCVHDLHFNLQLHRAGCNAPPLRSAEWLQKHRQRAPRVECNVSPTCSPTCQFQSGRKPRCRNRRTLRLSWQLHKTALIPELAETQQCLRTECNATTAHSTFSLSQDRLHAQRFPSAHNAFDRNMVASNLRFCADQADYLATCLCRTSWLPRNALTLINLEKEIFLLVIVNLDSSSPRMLVLTAVGSNSHQYSTCSTLWGECAVCSTCSTLWGDGIVCSTCSLHQLAASSTWSLTMVGCTACSTCLSPRAGCTARSPEGCCHTDPSCSSLRAYSSSGSARSLAYRATRTLAHRALCCEDIRASHKLHFALREHSDIAEPDRNH